MLRHAVGDAALLESACQGISAQICKGVSATSLLCEAMEGHSSPSVPESWLKLSRQEILSASGGRGRVWDLVDRGGSWRS